MTIACVYFYRYVLCLVKAFDTSSVCGLVWNVNYVAYRCRTCALSPCMSICAECFKNGDHAGHDFNMFRSGAGGACDCGDECVMNPKGWSSDVLINFGVLYPDYTILLVDPFIT